MPHRPPQYIVYKISDDYKNIVLESMGEKGASFEDFCSKLPDKECRFAILDVDITTTSGAQAHKLVFVQWCAQYPSTAFSNETPPLVNPLYTHARSPPLLSFSLPLCVR